MEALERRGMWGVIVALVLITTCSQCAADKTHRNSTKMSYVCPPQFIRLGHSCYFFSENQATWQNALFACNDRDSNLSVPARWEDRNLRNYLNKPDIEKTSRWIGGIYDYGARAWKWGGELRQLRYQSFSKMKKLAPEQLQWHCIAMMPELLYRWSPRSCFEPRHYICQTKLRKVPKSKIKDLRKRWQKMGKINEITAPSVSREVNDPLNNDVTVNPILNPKSYDLQPLQMRQSPMRSNLKYRSDLRPNGLRKRSGLRLTAQRKLKRPFPGYKWNRHDPESSFNYNQQVLLSGHTGLSPQQVKGHLARLAHLRDKQNRRRRNRIQAEWLKNEPDQALDRTHPRTYTIDNNISALHPKTIVEEFEMMPPPPPVVRPIRGAG